MADYPVAPPTRALLQLDHGRSVPGVRESSPRATSLGEVKIAGDYIPSDFKRRRASRGPTQAQLSNTRVPRDEIVFVEDVDFRPREESDKIYKEREVRINENAKRIIEQYRSHMLTYKKAKQVIKDASPEERKDPSSKLQAAIALVKKGPPITKAEALKRARAVVLRTF